MAALLWIPRRTPDDLVVGWTVRAGRALSALLCLSISGASIACSTPTMGQSVADVFERVRSSVVTVRTTSRGIPTHTDPIPGALTGIGSGAIISTDGLVVTAAHVVHTADDVEVTFADGSYSSARVVSSDPLADVALLQIKDPLPAAVVPTFLGDSDSVRVGDEVLVVGAPLGVSQTLTVGHISARRKLAQELHGIVAIELLQTDAAINAGNSGGPMFNVEGAVVGIVSHILSKSGGSDGLGFAVSSNVCRALLLDRPALWGGMSGVVVRGRLARALNIPRGRGGYLVQRVAVGSLSDRFGLLGGSIPASFRGQEVLVGGDIILDIEGIAMDDLTAAARLRAHFSSVPSGTECTVRVLRGGQVLELKGRIGEAD